MGVIRSIYEVLERRFFNTLMRKIIGNITPLLFIQFISLFSLYLFVLELKGSSSIDAESIARAERFFHINIALFCAALLLAIVNSVFLHHLIVKPLRKAIGFIDEVGRSLDHKAGDAALTERTDLSREIPAFTHDEIGDLARAYNHLARNMDMVFEEFQRIANGLFANMLSLTDASNTTVVNARAQTSQANSIAAASEEMSQTIADISHHAGGASETSEGAERSAQTGSERAGGAVATIERVHASTRELSTMIERLNARATEIGDIVTVIKDIADQTNLLALNAAIEAARAGDQGRGFAVVADEVRKLAERTIKSTAEIEARIGAVQSESSETARSMGEASTEVNRATGLIREVGESLESIVNEVRMMRDQITSIATMIEEQSATSTDISTNALSSSEIATKTESLMGGISTELKGLRDQAIVLKHLTARFKTRNSKCLDLETAASDVLVFLSRLKAHLGNIKPMEPERAARHRDSRFGRWYFGEGMENFGSDPTFREIEARLAALHGYARDSIVAFNAGRGHDAETACLMAGAEGEKIRALLDKVRAGSACVHAD